MTTPAHEPIPFCDGSGQDACVACSEAEDRCVPWPCAAAEFEGRTGVPLADDADKFKCPTWEEPGHCVCGQELPPQRQWIDAGRDWQRVQCSACGRGYVDEDDFIAFYSADDWAEYVEAE